MNTIQGFDRISACEAWQDEKKDDGGSEESVKKICDVAIEAITGEGASSQKDTEVKCSLKRQCSLLVDSNDGAVEGNSSHLVEKRPCKRHHDTNPQEEVLLLNPKNEVSLALRGLDTEIKARVVYEQVKERWKKLQVERSVLRELDFTIQNVSLSIGGLNLMIEQLRSRKGMEHAYCFVCEHVDDLLDCMKALKASSFEGKLAFFVRSGHFRSHTAPQYHVTPVLIEKRAGKTKVMLMDSTGRGIGIIGKDQPGYRNSIALASEGHYVFTGAFANNLYFHLAESETPDMTIYIASRARQKDTTNCTIFSLHDVKKFFQNMRFFEEMDVYGNCKQDKGDPKVQFVMNLPPENMKLTQSLAEIRRYVKENDQEALKTWFSTEGKERNSSSFEAVVTKGTRKNQMSGSQINMKVEDRFHKCLEMIVQVCRSHKDQKIAELGTRYRSSQITIDFLNGLNKGKV
jgi:hypothetical protein